MSESLVLVRDESRARILTLNRPAKRNALNLELLMELDAAIEKAAEDPAIRSLIITGAGRGFSAGIDFMALAAAGADGDTVKLRRYIQKLQEAANKLNRIEKPVIAVLHGFCMGFATELTLACDVRLAEAGCDINLAEVRLGLIPDLGGTTRLVRLVGIPRAKELIMTGKDIKAETAEKWNLVNQIAPEGQGLALALKWHEDFCQGAPLAVGLSKIMLDRAFDLDTASSMAFEGITQSVLFGTQDVKEGVAARIEKRPPQWSGK